MSKYIDARVRTVPFGNCKLASSSSQHLDFRANLMANFAETDLVDVGNIETAADTCSCRAHCE